MKKNTILMMIAAVLLLITVSVATYLLLQTPSSNEGDLSTDVNLKQEGNLTKPEIDDDLTKLQFDVVEYTVYDLKEVDFGFVIAKIRVKSPKESINIDLSHFKTNEGLLLSEVDQYVGLLEAQNCYLGKQNVWFDIVSLNNEYMGNIFIPYKDKSLNSIEVSVDLNESDLLKFDLKKKNGNKDLLYYKGDDIITDGKTYQMKVSTATEITGDSLTRVYPDGFTEDYTYPSTAEVYAFTIDAVSLWGDEVQIEDAIYEVEGSGNVFEAMDSKIKAMKHENIVGMTIKDKGKGALLFMTLNPEREPITYKGRLKIKLVGKTEWITINVDL